jgi:hypothetical protein
VRFLYLLLLAVPLALHAQDFADNFDDGDLDGWSCSSDCDDWFIKCQQSGGSAFCLLPFEIQRYSGIYPTGMSWTDHEIELDFMGIVGLDRIVQFRTSPDGTHYAINMRTEIDDFLFGKVGTVGGAWTVLVDVPFPNENGTWYHLRVLAVGDHIQVWVDEALIVDYVDPDPLLSGNLQLTGYTGGGGPTSVIEWDNVAVQDLGGTTSTKASTWSNAKSLFR